jgi:hypothetical protein
MDCLAVFGHHDMQAILQQRSPRTAKWLARQGVPPIADGVEFTYAHREGLTLRRVAFYFPAQEFAGDDEAAAWAAAVRQAFEPLVERKVTQVDIPPLAAAPRQPWTGSTPSRRLGIGPVAALAGQPGARDRMIDVARGDDRLVPRRAIEHQVAPIGAELRVGGNRMRRVAGRLDFDGGGPSRLGLCRDGEGGGGKGDGGDEKRCFHGDAPGRPSHIDGMHRKSSRTAAVQDGKASIDNCRNANEKRPLRGRHREAGAAALTSCREGRTAQWPTAPCTPPLAWTLLLILLIVA